LLNYLCQAENIKKIFDTEESGSSVFQILEKCSKIAYNEIIKTIEDSCGNAEEEKKEHDHDHSKEISELSVASNKFIRLLADEVMAKLCQISESSEEKAKEK
jgi:hypothetical protein